MVRVLFMACVVAALGGCSNEKEGSSSIKQGSADVAAATVDVSPTAPAANHEASLAVEGTHCAPSERIVYSCEFSKQAVVSVCEGSGELAYRYGPLGKPDLQLVSDGGYGNVSFGWLRGQGNGFQKSLRFANGEYSYTVYSAVAGDLSDIPGRRTSGLVVTKGTEAVLSGKLCPFKGAQQDSANFSGNLIENVPEDSDAAWL